MNWVEQMADAYSRGVVAGKQDLVDGVDSAERLAAQEIFPACFRQGYYHGQGKRGQGIAAERGMFLGI